MILASAGSGKTYALTNRFVHLLLAGAAPERIAALTFTRKAAGEFFDEILGKLARACEDGAFAARLAAELGAPAVPASTFRALLRSVVEAMPRLSLGTMDAFFARIVRAFPLELGLGGDFEILQDHAARLARRRACDRLFARAGTGLDGAQAEFIEAFKRATFGSEEKRLASQLDRYIDRHQELFLAAPRAELWGSPERIWPAGCPWIPPGDREEAAARLARLVAGRTDLGGAQRARWNRFFEELPDWAPGAPLPKGVDYILGNALAVWPSLLAGTAAIVLDRKKTPLSPEECAALAAVVRAVVGAACQRHIEITRGIHAVLDGFDRVYHGLVRRAGQLTFADVQRLLEREPPGSVPSPSGAARADPLAREWIDWRLDARFDHWLLDEFQDTSRGQWNVLHNLVDEALQDPSGNRTFFYVGDVKQAIYGWREGDARLFREIFEHYNSGAAPGIAERRLDRSHRSCPAVLDLVNRVFGGAEALADLFPAEAATRWSREWRRHDSALPDLAGHAAWLHAEDEPACFRATLDLLREIEPLARGLSAAVLVQRNETAARLADYLRQEGGIPAVAEADLHVCADNPLSAAVLALFQAAAHPGDTLARHHLLMSPLGAVLAQHGWATPDALTTRLLAQVHASGFERTVEAWLDLLLPALDPADAFSRERARQTAAAARAFDAGGSRDAAEFVRCMRDHTVRFGEAAGVVRVSTIHKAKGLGFDVVVLPDLEGTKLASRRDGLAVGRGPDHAVRWIYDLPPSLLRGHDAVLSGHVAGEEAEACYEKLALLYVATTRARRALYLVAKPPRASSSLNYPRLLDATLPGAGPTIDVGSRLFAGRYACGDPRWFTAIAPPPAPPAPVPEPRPACAWRTHRHHAVHPSERRSDVVHGRALFPIAGDDAAAHGRAIHAALATVQWWDPAAAATWENEQRARFVSERVIAEARACMEAPALAGVFRQPAGATVTVWRERAFDVVLEDAWITGVFDRVLVFRDGSGAVHEVRVFDFKTGLPPDSPHERLSAAAHHGAQLALYRRAAAVLTGVSPEQVKTSIVFVGATGPGRRVLPPVDVAAGHPL
jgi:ATP-dependent helicase/nuclease subunit A